MARLGFNEFFLQETFIKKAWLPRTEEVKLLWHYTVIKYLSSIYITARWHAWS